MAETVRIASYSPELTRKGPGLLLRDILKGEDEQIDAFISVVAELSPDILLLTGFDYDAGNVALRTLTERLAEAGADYPHLFSLLPNSGMATKLDMDGNGRTGEPRDAQGYGRFSGHGGMALLSRFPVIEEEVRDFSELLWKDLPGAHLPATGGVPFPSEEAFAIQRLSSTGHWVVPIRWPGRAALSLLAMSATPPVFDGLEYRNGLRNADEIRLWRVFLDGGLGEPVPQQAFVILGNMNLDPNDGDGRREAMAALLADPRLQDPLPASPGARAAADPAHSGGPGLDTAEWSPAAEGGAGNLRVDYLLPSADLEVVTSGVHWPAAGGVQELARNASRHRMVWVDISIP
ncbi:endonuclease/exonuclease/phosphatase family protein [Aliiruegeria lutimaris]|uniref:Endonuclease/Exonuclease/phosphatase family protein n=1 Tax=Aliiruegeria lutimaris TaxID=571298 RepID=A0A1G8P944_9RHOB|nr:endonuclease/exonuclease/phosphatase family protein [Aliiruegeria lutimaris]SDI88927.1 Endonuclease/Exonuclease/phosphatase family protein [Aliiruegeria lutimaris]